VVTGTLVFEGDARVAAYVVGDQDWLRQRPSPAPAGAAKKPHVVAAPVATPPARPKLGFKEQRELATLPARIEKLEAEPEALHARMADPAFHRGASADITAAGARLEEVESDRLPGALGGAGDSGGGPARVAVRGATARPGSTPSEGCIHRSVAAIT